MAIEILLKVAILHVFSNAMNCQISQWDALSNHGQSEIPHFYSLIHPVKIFSLHYGL